MTLGEIIKEYRTKNKISMDDFARQSGISKAYISILERNLNPISQKPPIPSLDKIKTAGAAMGLSLDEVLNKMGDNESVSLQSDTSQQLHAPHIAEDIVTFPIVTSVAAHFDSISIDETMTGDTVDIPQKYLKGRPRTDYCVMRVKGDSMYPDYRNGDIVLVLLQETLNRPGDIGVICYGDEEMTMKRIDYANGEDWLEMIPINPMYPPKRIEGVDLELFRIIGIPRLLLREI